MTIRRLVPGDAFRYSDSDPVMIWKGHGFVYVEGEGVRNLDIFKELPRIDGRDAYRVPFSRLTAHMKARSAWATYNPSAYDVCPICGAPRGALCARREDGASLRRPHPERQKFRD